MGDFTHTKISANRMAMYHQKELNEFCRVCGERISRNRVSFGCQQQANNIAQTSGVFCSVEMTVLMSILPIFAMDALASHSDQRQQQRRVNNTTMLSRHSLGPVTPQVNAPFVITLRKSTQEDDEGRCTESQGGLLP